MIEPVSEIPLTNVDRRISYREMIRNDIKEAYEKRIPKFELIGEYNYKYLNNYAREEGEKYFRGQIMLPVARKATEEISKKYPLEKHMSVYTPSGYDVVRNVLKVRKVKQEDRIHVYVEINYDFLDNYYNYCLEYIEEHYKQAVKRREERTRNAKL